VTLSGPDADKRLIGRHISIDVEAGDARPGVFDKFSATISSLEGMGAGQFALVVTIQPPVKLTSGVLVDQVLVASPEHDFLSKLSASESSQLSTPLPVVMWRLEDSRFMERIRATHTPPPATAYLGRAEMVLLP